MTFKEKLEDKIEQQQDQKLPWNCHWKRNKNEREEPAD